MTSESTYWVCKGTSYVNNGPYKVVEAYAKVYWANSSPDGIAICNSDINFTESTILGIKMVENGCALISCSTIIGLNEGEGLYVWTKGSWTGRIISDQLFIRKVSYLYSAV